MLTEGEAEGKASSKVSEGAGERSESTLPFKVKLKAEVFKLRDQAAFLRSYQDGLQLR